VLAEVIPGEGRGACRRSAQSVDDDPAGLSDLGWAALNTGGDNYSNFGRRALIRDPVAGSTYCFGRIIG
jgi:hypothetical protein